MIELKNVSKFYYQNGVIASGFSKVNLKFKMGEFVVITGESGSGKSTLLNVISGLDSYEEGEMYINGEETSHYTEADFEDYRRKYIGNIFQNFNLVNSYTVYQNIELVLLLNGEKKKNIKNKILDIIDTVGLKKFKNTKVSKLSGGQKQRVAIARALAKETPIIVADEPTGNLDTKSARQIMKLLHDISKNKLVIIVTHNKEQVEEYATRLIQMHDGRVLEDKVISKPSNDIEAEVKDYKNITILNRLRLGIRNTYNILPKFLLIFLVFFFVSVILIFEYSSFKEGEYNLELTGNNYIFSNTDTKRIVIKKNDKSPITENDLDTLKEISNVSKVVSDDVLLDTRVFVRDKDYNYYIDATIDSIDAFDGILDYGRMPENESEVIALAATYDWYLNDDYENVLDTEFYIGTVNNQSNANKKVKIVGIKKTDKYRDNNIFYLSDSIIEYLRFGVNEQYSDIRIHFESKYYESNSYSYHLIPTANVPKGFVYISEDMTYQCPNMNCNNRLLKVIVSNIYYNQELDLRVNKIYNKNNYKNLTGITNEYEDIVGSIFVNIDDYNDLFNRNTYQSSIFVDDERNLDNVDNKLQELGYKTLVIKNTIVNEGRMLSTFMRIFSTMTTIVLVIALFFIAYFVIKIILKSRSIYYTTVRILGGSRKITKQLLDIELFANATSAYAIWMILILLSKANIINVKTINDMLPFISLSECIIIYVILILMSQLISNRFARKIFKQTVMKTYREEAL